MGEQIGVECFHHHHAGWREELQMLLQEVWGGEGPGLSCCLGS